MSIWDIILYISAGVCYAAAAMVAIGWIKYARNK